MIKISRRTLRRLFILLMAVAVLIVAVVVLAPRLPPGLAGAGPEVAARQISTAILIMDYRDRTAWTARLYPLCSAEGRQFWADNLDQGLWGQITTRARITDEVRVERIQVLQLEELGDQAAAYVVVQGAVASHDQSGGRYEEAFQQDLILVRAGPEGDGDWLFAALAGQ